MDTTKKILNTYVPGVCNIGPEEINMRKKVGWTALIVTIVLWLGFSYLHLSKYWFLILFFPAAMSATGFIQGFSHFCAGFGIRGVFNFSKEVGKTDTVAQAEYRAADKKKAQKIFLQSILVGILVAIIAFLVK